MMAVGGAGLGSDRIKTKPACAQWRIRYSVGMRAMMLSAWWTQETVQNLGDTPLLPALWPEAAD